MIDRKHDLPVTRQCQLLGLNRSSVYYQPMGCSDEDLLLMRLIDEIHLKRPFYGSRRIRNDLQDLGHRVNRKKVQRLMRLMGITALYPKAKTSRLGKGHTIYTYFLRCLNIPAWNDSPLRHFRPQEVVALPCNARLGAQYRVVSFRTAVQPLPRRGAERLRSS